MSSQPFIGQKLYVDDQLHITHGIDDVAGGLATISHVETWPNGSFFVSFAELDPDATYSYSYLLENQARWAEEYGNRTARSNPDYRAEFNQN